MPTCDVRKQECREKHVGAKKKKPLHREFNCHGPLCVKWIRSEDWEMVTRQQRAGGAAEGWTLIGDERGGNVEVKGAETR